MDPAVTILACHFAAAPLSRRIVAEAGVLCALQRIAREAWIEMAAADVSRAIGTLS